MKLIFWFSLLFIIYTYVGYPLILIFWAKIRAKPVNKKYIEPSVSVIIAAYNEENFIGQKLENCLALDYPKDKLEIIVISDGSDDKTNNIIKRFEPQGIRLFSYKDRKGKAFALNLGISKAQGEIIFFTDARQFLEKDALKELTANFNDQKVASVSGELYLLAEEKNKVSKRIGLYWEIEKWMRKKESQINSILGATGSIYACRKQFVEPIPVNTILDDVLIPFRGIFQGYRSIFEQKAKAFDKASQNIHNEIKRKIRTLSGNYQLIAFEPNLLNPLKNPVFFQFMSHKIARLFVPFAMILLLVSNFFLTSYFYMIFLTFQLLFYLLALSARKAPDNLIGNMMKSLNVIFMMNYAAFISLFIYILNPQNIKWEKTS